MSTSSPSGSGRSTDDRFVPTTPPSGVAPDGRTWVHVTSGILRPSGPIRARATDSFQAMPHESGTNWKNLEQEKKDLYFNEFEKAFCWEESRHTREETKKAWVKEARVAYKDFVSTCKKIIVKQNKKIDYLLPDVEAAWRAYWVMPETQARSAQASRNRLSEPCSPGTGISIHHGGPRSALDHAEHLDRESNIPFDSATWATFSRIHYKNGAYTAGRPEQHGLEVERRVAELRETQEVTLEDVDRIFREVVAPDSRGSVMGLGMRMSRVITSPHGADTSMQSTSTSQYSFQFPVASQEEVAILRDQLDETRRHKEDQAAIIMQMQAQIAQLMRGYRPPDSSDASDATHPDLRLSRLSFAVDFIL